MKSQASDKREIDKYVAGELSAEKRIKFEARLQHDSVLQEELKLVRRLITGIRANEFKKMIKTIMDEEFGPREKNTKDSDDL